MDKNVIPANVTVVDRPLGLEGHARYNESRQRRINYIKTLEILDSTKCVKIDVSQMSELQRQSERSAIRHIAKVMKFKHPIAFYTIKTEMFLFTNRTQTVSD